MPAEHLQEVSTVPSILLVTAWFAPSRQIGARRIDRIANALHAAGWQVTVLCPHAQFMAPNDDKMAVPPVEILPVSVLAPRLWAKKVVQGRNAAAAEPLAPSSGKAGATKRRPMWMGLANKAMSIWEFPDPFQAMLLPALAAIRGRRFDVVLGSLPWRSMGPIAAAVARVTGAKLVLDYRDPWSEGLVDHAVGNDLPQHWHRWLEDRCLGQAALVTGVSPTIVRWLTARASCPVVLVTNAYEPVAVAEPPPPRPPIRLVYTGSLAYGRDLRPLLQALATAGLGPDQVVVDVAGPHGASVSAQAAELGLNPLQVVDHGMVSSQRAQELVGAGHVAVVLGSRGFEYAYPGKIFEILAKERPMWLLSPPGADAPELILRHRLGWVSDPSDVAAVASALAQILAGPVAAPVDLELLQARPVMADLEQRLRGLIQDPKQRAKA